MDLVLGDDVAVLTPGTTINNGDHQLSREEIRRAASLRFREKRRNRSKYSRIPADKPVVIRPRPQHRSQPPQAPAPREIINPSSMRLLFKKQLQNSDMNVAGRIVIPKMLAETHFPRLTEKEGIWMYMNDMDFIKVWTFKFKFWLNDRSRIYLLENTKDFTRTYGLMVGDYIIIYIDDTTGQYLVRARKQAPLQQPMDNNLNPELIQTPEIINPSSMRLLFEKQLKNSDVSVTGRIVIPKMFAETCLPHLTEKEGIWMHMNDMDFMKVWTFRFKFWLNEQSRIYLLENTKEFIRTYGLKVGDYIIIYKDDTTGQYLVRARKQVPFLPPMDNKTPAAVNGNLLNNSNLPNLGGQCSVQMNDPDQNSQIDFHDGGTPDYEVIGSTPNCERLNF